MSLRLKILLTISLTFIALIGILYIASRAILLNSFVDLEERNTRQQMAQALAVLTEESNNLNNLTADWSAWDDTYQFIETPNQEYIEANLVDSTFTTLNLNMVVFLDNDGRIVYSKAFDLRRNLEVPLPAGLRSHLSPSGLLLRHSDPTAGISGVIVLNNKPVLVAARPILTSEEEGPPRGTLIFGRYLDLYQIQRLAESSYLSLNIHSLEDPQRPPDFRSVQPDLSQEKSVVVRPLDNHSIAGYALWENIYGQPALVVRVDVPRSIYQHGQISVYYLTVSLVVVGIMFGLVTLFLVEKQVLSRLTTLNQNVNRISAGGDLSGRVTVEGRDELANLAGSINGMLAALAQSDKALRESEARLNGILTSLQDIVWSASVHTFNLLYVNPAVEKITGYAMEQFFKQPDLWAQIIHPDDEARVRHQVDRLIETGNVEREYRIMRPDGKIRWLNDRIKLVYDKNNNPLRMDGITTDITERKLAAEEVRQLNEELEQRVADRTRELTALYNVTAVANQTLSLSTMLDRSLEQVLEAMRSRVGAIHLFDETGQNLRMASQKGLSAHLQTQLLSLPVDTEMIDWVVEHGEPLVVPELNNASELGHGLHTYVGMPIQSRGQILGVLSVLGPERHQFNAEEVALLASIADQVGVAIESVRLHEQAERAAVIEERARLARELHDSVTQSLSSLVFLAGAGWRFVRTGQVESVAQYLEDMEETAQQALKELRLLIYELRPSVLEQEGLAGALQRRLEAVEGRAGIDAQLRVKGPLDLHPPVEEAIYRIAQEALNNVVKHAKTDRVTVEIDNRNSEIKLIVTDNGIGFDPATLRNGGGMGLVSIRERVEKMGGSVEIEAAPGEGTRIEVCVGLSDPEKETVRLW